MKYTALIQRFPPEWQVPLWELIETIQQDVREQTAVRRQDFEALSATVEALAEAQWRTEEHLERLEATVQALAEAQWRTEEHLERLEATVQALAEAQWRTEEHLERLETTVQALAEAQRRTEERVSRLEAIVAELAEAQWRTEERVSRLEAIVAELAEAQRRTEERVSRLEAIVAELAEAQRRTEERVSRLEAALAELAEAQRRTEERLERLEAIVQALIEAQRHMEEQFEMRLRKVENRLASMSGHLLEIRYREHATAYFGPLVRRAIVVSLGDLEEKLEENLTAEEVSEVMWLDLVMQGQLRQPPYPFDVLLAVEVSYVVDRNDVIRARRRADLLRKAGYPAVPVVAGQNVTRGALAAAEKRKVAIFRNGQVLVLPGIFCPPCSPLPVAVSRHGEGDGTRLPLPFSPA